MSLLFEMERIKRLTEDLGRLRTRCSVPVTSYQRLDGDGERWGECRIDEPWAEPESHRLYRTEAVIPKEMDRMRVELTVTTGREGQWDATNPQMVCYVNGTLIQGVDVNHRQITLSGCARAGERYEITLAAYSGSVRGDLILHTDLDAVEDEVEEAYYDFLIPLQAAGILKRGDEDHFRRILMKLGPAADRLDLRQPYSERFFESLREARALLKREFYTVTDENAPVVCAVGHTHIDIAWLWSVSQTREKAVRSFATVLHLMDRYPEYRFMSSQPILYQFVKEQEPGLYERIKERVKEGRWEVDGAMWLESDCNLPAGESLVRQIMKGERFFQEEFGISSQCLWLPDAFGYSAAIPQILKKCGIPYFMTTKIAWNQYNQLPNDTFLWKGIDGSTVFVFMPTTCDYDKMQGLNISFSDTRNTTTYTGIVNPNMTLGTYKRFSNRDLTEDTLMLYGFGDGGGGPTREMLESARRLTYGLPGIPRLRLAGEREFFDRTYEKIADKAEMPVWNGELYFEYHRGTLTSIGKNKRNNRKSELLYEGLEILGSMAYVNGGQYPAEIIQKGWDTILLNQFHDIIPGSAIEEVYSQSDLEYQEIRESGMAQRRRLFLELGNAVLSGIAWDHEMERPFLVVNTMGYERDDVVEVGGLDGQSYSKVRDAFGRYYEIQVTEKGSVLFFARHLPAAGFMVFFLIRGAGEATDTGRKGWNGVFENEWYQACFNDKMELTRLVEQETGCNLLRDKACGNTLLAYEDRPMNWDNWDIDDYYKKKPYPSDGSSPPFLVESGPVRTTVRIRHYFLDSVVEQDVCLYPGLPRIDFSTHVDWREHHVLLRVAFPTRLNAVRATYEIQYGNVERETTRNHSWDSAKFEVCAHKWSDLSEQGLGLSLLNDCKYGHSVRDGEMGLTLIKAGTYPNENADIGVHEFTYAVYPHPGRWQEARTVEMAYDLNVPLTGELLDEATKGTEAEANTSHPLHAGLSARWSMISVMEANCFLEVVKLAEDNDGLILRIYENQNKRTTMHVNFGFSVKTVTECNLLERPLRELSVQDMGFVDFIKPFEIKTYRLRLE